MASARLFRQQGLTGTGIKQILKEAGAGFSSLYHYFPGGKDQLATEVIRITGASFQHQVESTWDAAPDVTTAVKAVFDGAAALLEATGYADACPIATMALEVASTSEPLRAATAGVFSEWADAVTARLVTAGAGEGEARRLAFTVIALLEGGFLLCRATKSTEPLLAAGRTAMTAVQQATPPKTPCPDNRPGP